MNDLLMKNRATRAGLLARIRAGVGRPGQSGTGVDVAEVLPLMEKDGALNAQRKGGESGACAPIIGPRPGDLAQAAAGSPELKARFIRYALASSSTLLEVNSRADVPAAIVGFLAEHKLPRHAAIWAELGDLDWSGAGVNVESRAANGDDAVGITGAFCALAETGTLLTLSGPQTAATTSLLPETHIAVVPVSRIVAGMEEAFALVLAERGQLPRALNFISGPSRTGDIEQTIVLGAHGPSRVHLVLVNGA